jgi:hypothetical protein
MFSHLVDGEAFAQRSICYLVVLNCGSRTWFPLTRYSLPWLSDDSRMRFTRAWLAGRPGSSRSHFMRCHRGASAKRRETKKISRRTNKSDTRHPSRSSDTFSQQKKKIQKWYIYGVFVACSYFERVWILRQARGPWAVEGDNGSFGCRTSAPSCGQYEY